MTYAGDITPADQTSGNAVITDGGDGTPAPYVKPPKPAPTFTCIQSGEKLEKERVLRFVIGPENTLYPDFSEDLPGQPMWCNLYRPVVQAAIDNHAFGDNVIIPSDMMDQIERGLRHQALSMLSMCKKAGALLTGAEKTETMLKSGKAIVYLTASPKEADTRYKLSFIAQENDARVVDFFTSDELSKASGASKVFHAALGRGGTTAKFFVHVKRMNLFRDQTLTLQQEDTND